MAVFVGWVASYSTLLGGITAILPAFMAVKKLKRQTTNQVDSAGQSLKPLIRSELQKFAVSIVLFTVIFLTIKPLQAVFFFATFAALQLTYVVVPAIEAKQLRDRFKS